MKRRVTPYLGDSYKRANKTTLTKGSIITLSDINITLSESCPDDEVTEDKLNRALRRRRRYPLAPGPDKVRYSDIKNLTEEDRTELYAI